MKRNCLDWIWSGGFRSISGHLTIQTKYDIASENHKEHAISQNWWSADDVEFNFCQAYSDPLKETQSQMEMDEEKEFHLWLSDITKGESVSTENLLALLRKSASIDKNTVVTSEDPSNFITVSSQASVLLPKSSGVPCSYWFTATPHPSRSTFKPFIFCDGISIGTKTTSPVSLESLKANDRRHPLWIVHQEFLNRLENHDSKSEMTLSHLHELELNCLKDVEDILKNYDSSVSSHVSSLFHHMTNIEMNFY